MTPCATCSEPHVGPGEVCETCLHASCSNCGTPIAAGAVLCCRCNYGQMVEHQGEHVRDAFDMMRRNDATFLSAAGVNGGGE